MTLVGRALILLILVVIIYKTWGTLEPLKRSLKQYENAPQNINYKKMDVKTEIDDILDRFEPKSTKEDNKNGNVEKTKGA